MPAGKRAKCPACGQGFFPVAERRQPVPMALPFAAPAIYAPLAQVAPSAPRKHSLLAVALAAMLFLGSGIAAGSYFSHRQADPVRPSVAAVPAAVQPSVAAVPAVVVAADPPPKSSADEARQAEFQQLMVQVRSALADKSAKAAPVVIAAPETPPAPPSIVPQIGLANVPQIITDPQIGYQQLMNQAAMAMLDGRYDEAKACYTEALQLAPQAAPALSPDNCPPPPWAHASWRSAPISSVPFNRRGMPAGPANSTAFNGLRQAGYIQDMANGDANMRSKNYTEAAHAFQDALLKRPNDPTASYALTQAEAFAL
jgi:tetratricopeptide (TPR) repeat protein